MYMGRSEGAIGLKLCFQGLMRFRVRIMLEYGPQGLEVLRWIEEVDTFLKGERESKLRNVQNYDHLPYKCIAIPHLIHDDCSRRLNPYFKSYFYT